MDKKKPHRVSVAIYMTAETREELRQCYGESLTNGFYGNEQCFLFEALLNGVNDLTSGLRVEHARGE